VARGQGAVKTPEGAAVPPQGNERVGIFTVFPGSVLARDCARGVSWYKAKAQA
jgi:hypothetical protein